MFNCLVFTFETSNLCKTPTLTYILDKTDIRQEVVDVDLTEVYFDGRIDTLNFLWNRNRGYLKVD